MGDDKRKKTAGTPRKTAEARTEQSSVSLPPQLWRSVERYGDLTQLGRSATVAQAIELLLALPLPTAQRFAVLSRTAAGDEVRKRYVAAVEAAMRAAEAEIGESLALDAPFGEFEAALADLGRELKGSPVAAMSEEALIAAAETAQAGVRRRRVPRRAAGGRVAARR